jgi:pimeloyl-ACP methyl ester carboxylesterase
MREVLALPGPDACFSLKKGVHQVPVEYQLVTLTADDGHEHDALFVIDERAARRRMRMTGRSTACMHVHGIMGNFLVGTLRFLSAPLAREGFPVLIVETRMGNIGQLVGPGIFDRARQDLTAGSRWLREGGWDHLISMGYSSGASLSTRWAATAHVPWLRGLALLGAPWGLPEAMEVRAATWGATPSYDEIYARADAVVHDPSGPEADRLFVIEHSRGPSAQPQHSEVYTYRTWWNSRGPKATAAKTHLQIAQVRAPILLVQGTTDIIVSPQEAEQLAEVARQGGNDDVEVSVIEGADHFFAGREFVTIEAVVRWLREHA